MCAVVEEIHGYPTRKKSKGKREQVGDRKSAKEIGERWWRNARIYSLGTAI